MTHSNNLFQKVSACLLILTVSICSMTSCQTPDGKNYESHSSKNESAQATEVQTAFDEFTMSLFREEITENTLNLHYTLEDPSSCGISDYPLTLGEFSQKDTLESCEQAKKLQEKLKAFDYDALNSSQQLTYDILNNNLELSSSVDAYPYYTEVLQPSIGLHAELPTLFAEYTFNTEKDITDYFALLEDMERYFDQIITYEQEKANAGLFMSDYCADLVIRDCESFLSQTEDNFLIVTFEERLNEMDQIDDAKKKEYTEKNRALVTTNMFHAYQTLIDALKELKGSGVNDGGLSRFENGRDYYNYLLKLSTGSDRSVKELEQMTLDQINTDLQEIQSLMQANPQLSSAFNQFSFTLTDPEEIIEDLKVKMQKDFPELKTDINLNIKYVSKSMEKSLSPAFYLTPPIDNLTDNVIYINGGSSDASDLYTTLAHEGYPGHLYQTVYSASCNDDPIRQICSVAGYSEGWATYVENMAYSYDTELDENLTSLIQHNSSANLGIYALLDFYINYEGWTLEETGDWLKNLYSTNSEDTIKELYYLIVSQPCNYLKYYIGYLEILDLRADAQEALEDRFVLKDFHTFLLEIGDAPFYLIRDYMEDWINEYSAG